MDIRKVKKLIEMMQESDIVEMEIREGEDAVRISRAGAPVAPSAVAPPAAAVPAAVPAAGVEPPPPPESQPAQTHEGHVIAAPMVGTFYRAPAPGAAPFVEIGDEVSEGETLCIIESMKMMNHITADRQGRVTAILVDNEEPVEFDQPLFTLD